MRIVALSLLVFSSSAFAGDQTANKAAPKPAADQAASVKADTAKPAAQPAAAPAKPVDAAVDTTTAKPAAAAASAQDNSMSSVAKSMKEPKSFAEKLEAAIAYELSFSKPFGLTIYKGQNFLLPGLTELGLNSKLPDPIFPGQDETVPDSMPPSENAEDKDGAKGTEAK